MKKRFIDRHRMREIVCVCTLTCDFVGTGSVDKEALRKLGRRAWRANVLKKGVHGQKKTTVANT